MPQSRGQVRWVEKTLFKNLAWFRDSVESSVQSIVEDFADEVEAYMKQEAPWEDRTGDARTGLKAEAYHRGTVSGLLLSHGVDYGLWLEVRWGGRFAIITPTLREMGPVLMQRLAERTFDEAEGRLGESLGAGDIDLGEL